MAKDEYEEIGLLNIWTPKQEGEVLKGTILSVSERQFGKMWVIDTGDSEIQTPSHKVLQNRLEQCKVGDAVKITYQGKVASNVKGRNPTEMYKVEKKR